ncbi:hypothetical protein Tco_1293192 [Tanacetum coccineum]
MVIEAEDPKTRTTSGVRSTEDMDRAINDLTSKFASMSTAIDEIRSKIVGDGYHINLEGNNHGWRQDDFGSSDEEGDEVYGNFVRAWFRWFLLHKGTDQYKPMEPACLVAGSVWYFYQREPVTPPKSDCNGMVTLGCDFKAQSTSHRRGNGLLGPNGGSYGGKGGRGGSMAGRGGGWLAKRSIVSNEGRGGGGLVVWGANGKDCLDGCDGAGGGEVTGGGVDLGVFNSGEAGRRLTKQQARTLIRVVLFKALSFFLSLFDFVMVKVEIGGKCRFLTFKIRYAQYTDQPVPPVPCAELNRHSIMKGTGGLQNAYKKTVLRKQRVLEDASKQGGALKILMQMLRVLDDDEVFVDVTTVKKEEKSTKTGEAVTTGGVEDSAAPTIPTIVEETLAQTLMEIKAAKRKAKGIVFHNQEEQVYVSKLTVSVKQPSVKDKGKAQLDAEIIEEERLERQKQEEANIALIESWENTKAMMEQIDLLLRDSKQEKERS